VRLRSLVSENTENRQFGLLGERRVNVLELNLALDRPSKQYSCSSSARSEAVACGNLEFSSVIGAPRSNQVWCLMYQGALTVKMRSLPRASSAHSRRRPR
jgi:K+-transporting ATPase, c chain